MATVCANKGFYRVGSSIALTALSSQTHWQPAAERGMLAGPCWTAGLFERTKGGIAMRGAQVRGLVSLCTVVALLACAPLATTRVAAQEKPSARPQPGGFRLVMTTCGSDWDAFRFNQQTGETWWPNTDKDPDWAWLKVADSLPPPAGDYVLQGYYFVEGDAKTEKLIRMDRKTGRAWIMVDLRWLLIGESPDFATAHVPRAGFQLVMSGSPVGWKAIRFDPETGAAWTPGLSGDEGIWQKFAEPEPLAAGEYELQVVSYVSDGKGTARMVRFERRTGRSWMANDDGWFSLDEPDDFAASPAPADGFRLVLDASAKYWYIYRLNPETGDTWLPASDATRTSWRIVPDDEQLPRGNYDLQVVSFLTDDGGEHRVLRMERKFGRMWITWDDRQWHAVGERSDITTTVAPRAGFRMVSSDSDQGWYAIRVHPETGECWAPNEYDEGWYADRWIDNPRLKGDFDVQMAAFIDGNDATENVYRMERQSGQSWVFITDKWVPLSIPAAPMKPGMQPPGSSGYQLMLSPSPTACRPYRFDSASGYTWSPDEKDPMVWDAFIDDQPLPRGAYALGAKYYRPDGEKNYFAILRIDTVSGQTWHVEDQKWHVIAEPSDKLVD
jgi:hypothetical protein